MPCLSIQLLDWVESNARYWRLFRSQRSSTVALMVLMMSAKVIHEIRSGRTIIGIQVHTEVKGSLLWESWQTVGFRGEHPWLQQVKPFAGDFVENKGVMWRHASESGSGTGS